MRPSCHLALACLLLAAAPLLAEEDPRTIAFNRYRAESLKFAFSSSEATSEERAIGLRGLDKHDCPAAAQWLIMKVLVVSDEGDVLREAVRVLSKYGSQDTIQTMAQLWGKAFKKNVRGRVLLTLAMARVKSDESRGVMKLALKSKDARLVAAACRAIGKGDDDTFKDALLKLFKHKEPMVRAETVFALAELHEIDTKPQIFGMFCKDKSNFVRFRAWQALRKLERNNRLPCEIQAWMDWWEEKASSVEEGQPNPWGKVFPGGQQTLKASSWFGIPVLADRIVFVLDATQKMDQGWTLDPGKERKKPPEKRIPNFFSVKTRYGLAFAYLNDCIKRLPDTTQVAVTFYHDRAAPPNHSIYPDNNKWLKLKRKKVRAGIKQHVKELEPGGTSSLYEGLVAAFEFGAKKKPVQNGVQVICFLTVGAPTAGEFKDRRDRVKGQIWAMMQERGIVLNCVGLHNHAFALLKDFAKETGGIYVHQQQEGDTVEPQDLDFWPDKKAAFEAARRDRKSGK